MFAFQSGFIIQAFSLKSEISVKYENDRNGPSRDLFWVMFTSNQAFSHNPLPSE